MNWIYSTWMTFQNSPLLHALFAVLIGLICAAGAVLSPIITIFALVGIIFLTAGNVISKPMVLCYLLILAIVMTSAMERGRIIPMLVPSEVVLIMVFGISAAYVITQADDKPISVTILFGTLILILGTAVIPILSYGVRGIDVSFFTMFKWIAPAQYLLLFWIFSAIPRTHDDRLRVLQVMFAAASLVAIIGLLQAARIPIVLDILINWYPSGHTEQAILGTYSGMGRTTSVFGAWNVTGAFLMINILVLAALQIHKLPRLYAINMAISAVLSLMGLLASGSYSALAGLAIGFVLLKSLDPRGLKELLPFFGVMILGIILLFPVISQRLQFQFGESNTAVMSDTLIPIPNTLAWRFEQWTTYYLPLVARDPIWGATPSFENFSFSYVDSQYLEMLISTGFVSLASLIIWLGFVLTWLLHIIRHEYSVMRSLALATTVCFFILIIMGVTNPVFRYTGVMDYLWIYLGLIASSRNDKLHVAY